MLTILNPLIHEGCISLFSLDIFYFLLTMFCSFQYKDLLLDLVIIFLVLL